MVPEMVPILSERVLVVALLLACGAQLGGCIGAESQGRALVASEGEDCPTPSRLGARPYDAQERCLLEAVVLCAESSVSEANGCARHPDTGELYSTSYPLIEEPSLGWEACSDEEVALVVGKFPCDP